jgi:hypothetical protein
MYAKKGEHIVCENGHVIFTLENDIPLSKPQDTVIPRIKIEDAQKYSIKCPHCNKSYARWTTERRIEFYINNEWRKHG